MVRIFCLNLQVFEQTMTEAPFSIASSINFSPFNFFSFNGKKNIIFLTFYCLETPLMIIFSLSFEIFLIKFFNNMLMSKLFVIYG